MAQKRILLGAATDELDRAEHPDGIQQGQRFPATERLAEHTHTALARLTRS